MNSRNRNPLSTSPRQLSDLVDRHAARLVLYARQICSEPEDVVQEAFLELCEPPVQPKNLTAWLFRVVRNRLMKTLEDEDAMANTRSFLVKEAGYKEAAVKKMAATQVLLLCEGAQYERLRIALFNARRRFLVASLSGARALSRHGCGVNSGELSCEAFRRHSPDFAGPSCPLH